jgi:hypothetical protein
VILLEVIRQQQQQQRVDTSIRLDCSSVFRTTVHRLTSQLNATVQGMDCYAEKIDRVMARYRYAYV